MRWKKEMFECGTSTARTTRKMPISVKSSFQPSNLPPGWNSGLKGSGDTGIAAKKVSMIQWWLSLSDVFQISLQLLN